MKDENKTKKQLIDELALLRRRNTELEKAEAEHNKREELLKISEHRFRTLIEHTTESLFCYEYDPSIPTNLSVKEQIKQLYRGILAECNDVCAKSYGAKRADEVIGKKLTENFGASPGTLDELFRAFIKNGYKTVDEEGVEILDDGSERYYLNNTHGVIENGMLIRVWGTFRDITDRKQSAEELAKAKTHLENSLASSPDGVLLLEKEGKFSYVNPTVLKWLGREAKDFIGKTILDVSPPIMTPEMTKIIGDRTRKRLKTGEPIVEAEIEIINKDSKVMPVSYSAAGIKDDKGNILGEVVFLRDITDRKKAEEELRAERDFIKKLIDTSPMFFAVIDSQGKTVTMNNSMLRTLGYSETEVQGADYLSTFIPKEDRKQLYPVFKKLIHSRKPTLNENHVLAKDGRKLLVEWHGCPITDPKGKVDYFFGVGVDITERKKAEKELQESEKRYRALFEGANDAIFIMEGDKVIECNEMTLRMFGCKKKEEILGYTPWDFSPPTQPDGSSSKKKGSNLINSVLDGNPQRFYWKHIKKNGEPFDAAVSLNQLEIEEKTFIQTIVRNITRQMRVEEALKESEEQYRALYEGAPDAIFLADMESGKILDANLAATKLLNKPKEKIVGFHQSELHPQHRDKYSKETFKKHMQQVIEMKKTLPVENTILRSDGKEIPVEVLAQQIRIKGKPVLQGVFRDITERKKAEEALRTSEERLSSFMNSAEDSFYLLDSKLNFIDINKKGLEIIGKKKEDVIGKNITEIVPDVKESGRYEKHLEVIRTGKPFMIEHFVPHPKFGEKHFILKSFKVGDGLGVTAIDITEQKQVENALRESEERFKILYEYAPDAYYLSDLKGNFIDGNKAAEELVGYKKDELIGKSFLKLKLLSRKDIPKASALLAKNALGKPTGPDEFELKRKDNTPIVVEISTYPIKIKGDTLILSIARDITERRRVQEELKASEEKFQKTFNKNAIPMMLADFDTRTILDVNEAFTRILGYTAKEVVNIPGKLGFTIISSERFRQIYKILEKKNSVSNFEVESMNKNGEKMIGLLSAEALTVQKKKLLIVSMIDITERKRAEEALRKRGESLRAIVENSKDWIWSIDTEGNHTYSNPAVEEILGYPPDKLTGKSSLDLMHPKDKREIEVMLAQWIKEKQGWQNLVIRWQHKDGSWRWLESNAAPTFDSEGILTGFLGVDRDITERKRIEEELRESEARFRVLSEAAFEGIVVSDKAVILDANDQFAQIFGYKKPELIGISAFNLVAPESRELVKKNIESDYEETYEHQALRKDGTVITVEVTGKSIPYKGRLVRVTAIRDVTERKKVEKEIQNYQEKLRSLASRLSLTEEKERRLIATFLHDQISQKLALAKMKFGAMTQSLSAAEHHKPANEIRDLIDETIQDTRTLTFELSPPILYELGLEQSIEWLMEQFGEKYPIQFLFKDDGKPKPIDDDIRTILFQSVRELLTNTIKHSQAKTVKVSTRRERNKIQLTVEDDGIGFDPSKAKPYSMKTGGFGLFNIRERLEDFYGIMDIKSKKGQGTRVTLLAPLSLKKVLKKRK